MKFLGRTFLPTRKARNNSGRISGQISEKILEKKIGNYVSNFATFFGNFVQQKGGANKFELGNMSLTICLCIANPPTPYGIQDAPNPKCVQYCSGDCS